MAKTERYKTVQLNLCGSDFPPKIFLILYPTFGIVDEMNDIAHLSCVAYRSNPGKFCFLSIVFGPPTPDCQKRYSWLKYPDTYCIRSSCKIRSAQIRLYSLICEREWVTKYKSCHISNSMFAKLSIYSLKMVGWNESGMIWMKNIYSKN